MPEVPKAEVPKTPKKKMEEATKWTIGGVLSGLVAEALLLGYMWYLEANANKETAIVYTAKVLPESFNPPFSLMDFGTRINAKADISTLGVLHLTAPYSYISDSIIYKMSPPYPNIPNGLTGFTAIMKCKYQNGGPLSPTLIISDGIKGHPSFGIDALDRVNRLHLFSGDVSAMNGSQEYFYDVDSSNYFRVRLTLQWDGDKVWRGKFWLNDELKFNGELHPPTDLQMMTDNQLIFGLFGGTGPIAPTGTDAWIEYLIFDGAGAFSPEEKSDSHYLQGK